MWESWTGDEWYEDSDVIDDEEETECEIGNILNLDEDDYDHQYKTYDYFVPVNRTEFSEIKKQHPKYQNDSEFLSSAIATNNSYIQYASPDLLKDKKFVIECIRKFYPSYGRNHFPMEKFDPEFLNDQDVVRTLVRYSPLALTESLKIWDNSEFFLECLMINPRLMNNIEVKSELILLNFYSHFPNRLSENDKFSKEFYVKLIENKCIIPVDVLPNSIQNDDDFMKFYLNNVDLPYLGDFKFNDSLLNDRSIVKLILKKYPTYLSRLDEKSRNDRELVELAMSVNPNSFAYAGDELKDDWELVLRALEMSKKPKEFVEMISERLRGNGMVMIEAVKKSAYLFLFATEELQFNQKFVVDSLDCNRKVLEYIDESMKNDIDIQMILEGMYHKLRMKNEGTSRLSDLHFNFVN